MRQLCYALFVTFLFASCRDKVICPAFQSTYILDDSVRNTYFSYAWYLSPEERNAKTASQSQVAQTDSLDVIATTQPTILPPDSLGEIVASADQSAGVDYFAYTADYKVLPREIKKTKYGIIKRTPVIPNIVRNFQLKTSPMQNVLTPPELRKEEEVVPDLISSALAPLDSTATIAAQDSLNVVQPDSSSVAVVDEIEEKKKKWIQFKYGFKPSDNMQPDQEYYFRRYGWLLQNAPPREEPVDTTQQTQSSSLDSLGTDSTSQSKGLKGLFKKKDKKKRRKKGEGEPASEAPVENGEATKPEEGEGTGEEGNQ